MSNIIEMPKVGLSGKVLQWEVINADGSIDQSCYRPSDNVITDIGLDQIGTVTGDTDFIAYFCIGTGTAEPSATDTKLTAETYRSTCAYATYDSTTASTAGSDPYYIYTQRGVQTSLGALNGTYGEIGFSPYASANHSVLSKHRLKDENGDPTTITVSSAQQLRLKYVLVWCFSPSTQTTGTISISGVGDVGYTAGWQAVNTSSWLGVQRYLRSQPTNTASYCPHRVMNTSTSFSSIGSSKSAASYAVSSSLSEQAYVAGNHYHIRTLTCNVDTANGTIYGVCMSDGYIAAVVFMILFDTPFVKADTHMFTFTTKISWGRS